MALRLPLVDQTRLCGLFKLESFVADFGWNFAWEEGRNLFPVGFVDWSISPSLFHPVLRIVLVPVILGLHFSRNTTIPLFATLFNFIQFFHSLPSPSFYFFPQRLMYVWECTSYNRYWSYVPIPNTRYMHYISLQQVKKKNWLKWPVRIISMVAANTPPITSSRVLLHHLQAAPRAPRQHCAL